MRHSAGDGCVRLSYVELSLIRSFFRRRGDTLGGIVQRQQPLFQARGVSLLQTDGPKLVFKSAGLGVRHQREAGCFAPLDIREFLSRYCGTIYSPAKPAHDD